MKSRILALIAVCAWATTGCSGDSFDGREVVLGAIIDQTGNNSELSWLQAVELAVEHMNDALEAEGSFKDFRFRLSVQNSENDVVDPNGAVNGANSRAMQRIRDAFEDGAKAATIDTTQIAEVANRPSNHLGIPLQCSSCTGGSFLSATSAAVAGDDDLTASRRNTEFWMSRTIMSTGLQAQVVAQLINASPNRGDLNGDGIIKIYSYGSNEPFGSATTLAVATELLKFFPVGDPDREKLRFERRLHVNAGDPRDIDFVGDVDSMLDTTNLDLAGGTRATVNPHLAADLPTTDGVPDFITAATFGRNDVAFISEIRGNRNVASLANGTLRVIHFQTFRFSSNLLALGELAEGEIGVSHVVKDGAPGDLFEAAFREKFGVVPVYRDSIYYDNAMTMLFAMLSAISDPSISDPRTIEGVAVRDAMPCSSVLAARAYAPECQPVPPATTCVARPATTCPAGTPVQVSPGVDSIRGAVRAISAGQPIEYTGGSGPVDYDALGNVKNRVANFTVRGGRYVDLAVFDCVGSNTCPCLPGVAEGACP